MLSGEPTSWTIKIAGEKLLKCTTRECYEIFWPVVDVEFIARQMDRGRRLGQELALPGQAHPITAERSGDARCTRTRESDEPMMGA
jgi:hypothetical protein